MLEFFNRNLSLWISELQESGRISQNIQEKINLFAKLSWQVTKYWLNWHLKMFVHKNQDFIKDCGKIYLLRTNILSISIPPPYWYIDEVWLLFVWLLLMHCTTVYTPGFIPGENIADLGCRWSTLFTHKANQISNCWWHM